MKNLSNILLLLFVFSLNTQAIKNKVATFCGCIVVVPSEHDVNLDKFYFTNEQGKREWLDRTTK